MMFPKIGNLYRMKEDFLRNYSNSFFANKIFILLEIKIESPLIPEFNKCVVMADNKTYEIYEENFVERFEEVL